MVAPKTLVVIPTYNEIESVPRLISKVCELLPEVHILVVDDGSPDGTATAVEGMNQGELEGRIFVLRRKEKAGLGAAYLAGFEWGFAHGYGAIVEMDADGSHRPDDLVQLMKAFYSDPSIDLVIGSRWVAGGAVLNWPKIRELISKVGNRYAKFMLGTSIFDMTSGFRIFRSEFLQQLVSDPVSSHGYSFQVELAYRASKRGKVLEIPISFIERVDGKSKMTLAIVLEALTKVTFWGLKRILG